MKLNTTLSQEQAQFAVMLEEFAPYLLHLWNFPKRAYFAEAVDGYLASASPAEAQMARFFLGVWRQDNHYNFNLIEAATTLSERERKIVSAWMMDPFCP